MKVIVRGFREPVVIKPGDWVLQRALIDKGEAKGFSMPSGWTIQRVSRICHHNLTDRTTSYEVDRAVHSRDPEQWFDVTYISGSMKSCTSDILKLFASENDAMAAYEILKTATSAHEDMLRLSHTSMVLTIQSIVADNTLQATNVVYELGQMVQATKEERDLLMTKLRLLIPDEELKKALGTETVGYDWSR